MATKSQYKKQVKKHTITWSEREKRYIIKNPKGKRIYDADTEKSTNTCALKTLLYICTRII